MTQAAAKIRLKNLCFLACHGCNAAEKVTPQQFRVNLELTLREPFTQAAALDDLSLTVDYGALYLRVKDLVERQSFNLIETLAERIAALALAEPLVGQVCVEVEKSRAAVGEECFTAAVLVERSKEPHGEDLSESGQ